MKFGSVCSGIEAASVAWEPLGWKAAWLSEIEPFPSAVLAHHYPDVPNLGDMTQLPDRIASGEVEAPDLFCGGTPCQAFSVAGLRKSLDDARGNLSLVFCEIANAIDTRRAGDSQPPAIIFWENVPGVLSTKDNAFGCFLAGLAGEDDPVVPPGDKWTNAGVVLGPQRAVAWRVLDAQYFGVAQRRRRVFVVASARNGFDPAAVLFEWDSLRRDSAPSREARKGFAQGTGTSATFSCGGIGAYSADSASATLLKSGQDLGNGCEALVTETFDFQSSGEYGTAPVAATLSARDYKSAKDLAVHPIAFPANLSATQHASAENIAPSMGAKNPTAVAFQSSQSGIRISDTHATLDANNGPRRHNGALVDMAVRRLTPVECERLQGFPDNYTLIPWKAHQAWAKRKGTQADGKSFEEWLIETTGRGLREPTTQDRPDGPRYKALGNSWAVPVVRWIGARIDKAVAMRPG